ncbi:Intracellular serine protease [Thermococcus sp. 2319x1]|uniref:S8 family peptidase n=1 Tax=Thermococcus sp. 2319x1 TaxID=1674923 RepID=UPI00073ADB68|nr:S8 family peptidase [Thermococcus sp. 2319x1]ALV62268.1 Intracellular serine protease [Thermococcus sp. 2319x1]
MEFNKVFSLLLVFVVLGATAGIVGAVSAEKVRVIITIDKDFNENSVFALGGNVVARGKVFPIVIAELSPRAVERLKNAKGVVRVEYDAEVQVLKGKSPGAGKPKPSQPAQTIPWGIERIKAPDVWSITDGSSSGVIEVAILDTGIDYDHPDLAANLAWGVSVLRGKVSTKPKDYKDQNGHGTHVAGTVAALNNDIGVVGVAPAVEIYAVRVLDASGRGSYSDIILGIEQALLGPDGVLDSDGDGIIVGDPDDDAAEVISMSLGGLSDVQAFHDAIIEAYNYGVVIVAASGNEGASSPSYPAAYPEVIAVGATDVNDQVPWWSNRGVEVSAPGVDVLSTYPDDSYETLSGTSMATPHVSGVVALIQAAYYNKYGSVLPVGTFDDNTMSTVRGILHITADDLGSSGWDADYGYGIVRADLAVQAVN